MRYRRAVRAALRLVLMLSVVSVGSAALVACNPACAAADEKEPRNWGEWFRTDHSARQAGEKKPDRKSTRLNSSHVKISYAVFCLKKKKQQQKDQSHQTPNTRV